MPPQSAHYQMEGPNLTNETVYDTVPSNSDPQMESLVPVTLPTQQTEPSTTTNESVPQVPVIPIESRTVLSDAVSPMKIQPVESGGAIPPLRTSSRLKKQTKQYDASSGTWK